jgi:hypothetical protein
MELTTLPVTDDDVRRAWDEMYRCDVTGAIQTAFAPKPGDWLDDLALKNIRRMLEQDRAYVAGQLAKGSG